MYWLNSKRSHTEQQHGTTKSDRPKETGYKLETARCITLINIVAKSFDIRNLCRNLATCRICIHS